MKKIILSLTIVMFGYCSYCQNSFPLNGDVTVGTNNTSQLIKAPYAGGAIEIRTNSATTDRGLSFGLIGNDHTTYVPYLTVTQDGKVGIGTTIPNTSLAVKGSIQSILDPNTFPAKNVVNIIGLDFSGVTGARNWAIRGVYQYSNGVGINADGGDLDIIKSYNGNTILATKSDGNALGRVGIGTTNPDATLAVKGNIHTQELKIDMNGWSDYVFEPVYRLPSLASVKAYIDQNHHLPEIPATLEIVKNGVNLGEMLKLQTKKIEELTLYAIQQKEYVDSLKEENKKLKDEQQKINQAQEVRIAALEKALSKLTDKQ